MKPDETIQYFIELTNRMLRTKQKEHVTDSRYTNKNRDLPRLNNEESLPDEF